MHNVSWVISYMAATTTDVEHSHFFANSLKEYEIITFISNRKKNMQVRFIMILCASGI